MELRDEMYLQQRSGKPLSKKLFSQRYTASEP